MQFVLKHFLEKLIPSSPIWLDDVDCRGDESEISHCAHLKLGSHNCQHYEDVGVECGVSITI